jgi:cobalt-precorrin 5A hydrolase
MGDMPAARSRAAAVCEAARETPCGAALPRLPARVALVAITRAGARMAAEVAKALPGAVPYASARWASEGGGAATPLAQDTKAELARLFRAHDGLVVFAAVGVVVRLIAPCLRDKTSDPAVVAVDDAGRYAVSVLSGHLGGGNALTTRVAAVLGASPVITTASEAHGLPAVDLLGCNLGWRAENLAAAKIVSAALVNAEPVGTFQDAGEADWWPADAPSLRRFETLDGLAASNLPGIVVSDRVLPANLARPALRWVILRPRTLVLGVGASTGVAADEIESLARTTLEDAGLIWACLAGIATLDRKLAEPGIAQFAARHGLPMHGFSAVALAAVPVPHPSATVARHVATPSVCEAAAVLAAGGGSLVATKRKSARATVAVARRQTADEVAGTATGAVAP